MTTYNKPLPVIDSDNKEFWESCKRHEMRLQKCKECGYVRYYPSPVCHKCSSFNAEWAKMSGYGTIYTFSVVYRPPSEAFVKDVPYVYGIVELDEGPMMPTNIVGIEPEKVRIGMRVQVTYKDVTPEVTLPQFKPLETPRRT